MLKNPDDTCLHCKYSKINGHRCDLLTGTNDCDTCSFYVDKALFKYGRTVYNGVDCVCIERRK